MTTVDDPAGYAQEFMDGYWAAVQYRHTMLAVAFPKSMNDLPAGLLRAGAIMALTTALYAGPACGVWPATDPPAPQAFMDWRVGACGDALLIEVRFPDHIEEKVGRELVPFAVFVCSIEPPKIPDAEAVPRLIRAITAGLATGDIALSIDDNAQLTAPLAAPGRVGEA